MGLTLVFWIIISAGTIGVIDGSVKLNKKCKNEVAAGVSKTIKECKQYHFDNKINSGW
jgi:hypothetical protein